jgi:hypothetical protein
MNSRLSRTCGLVGSRAFEAQASNSLGARAVEEMVWERSCASLGTQPERKPFLMRLQDAIWAAIGPDF